MDNVSPEKNDVKSCPRDSGYDSLSNKLSILDKLLHTHPVWLQLGLNDAETMEILQTQPPGVRRISISLRTCFSQMLCCHFTPKYWTHYSNDQIKTENVLVHVNDQVKITVCFRQHEVVLVPFCIWSVFILAFVIKLKPCPSAFSTTDISG